MSNDADFRAKHIGAAEVAALFDCHPWTTRFELWHRKAGTLTAESFEATERTRWGLLLEPAILTQACKQYGWTRDRAAKRRSNGRGLGGHMDGSVICTERGPGILEVKCVDWLQRKDWGDEPPLNYLLQMQTYMGLSGRNWGALAALVSGNALERFDYEFRPTLFAEIERRVDEFWASVAEKKPPKPDYGRDGDVIGQLWSQPDNEALVDLRGDNRAAILASEFLEAKAAEKAAAERAEAARAELLDKLGLSGAALVDGYRITAKRAKDTAGKLITEDMVGQTIGAKAGHRRFVVKEIEYAAK